MYLAMHQLLRDIADGQRLVHAFHIFSVEYNQFKG